MADRASEDDRPDGAGGKPTVGAPRWVKAFGIIALVVAVLIVVMLATGHGPGRHMGSHGGLGVPSAPAVTG